MHSLFVIFRFSFFSYCILLLNFQIGLAFDGKFVELHIEFRKINDFNFFGRMKNKQKKKHQHNQQNGIIDNDDTVLKHTLNSVSAKITEHALLSTIDTLRFKSIHSKI